MGDTARSATKTLKLPKVVVTGDKFRIKETNLESYRQSMTQAGYSTDRISDEFVATGQDEHGPGGRTRIKTDREPWYVFQSDVIPVFYTEEERYYRLTDAGWEQLGSGKWRRK